MNAAFADGPALTRAEERWLDELALRPGETMGTLTEDDEATILYILSRHPKPQMVS